ncbi:MAG: NUDIX domain-containing protein [Flavobacteriales bacterium]|nr:NUDIX domain-containing protein [Flavobacteriales bacterium]
MMDELTARLQERLTSPLPGLKAQLRMASNMRVKAAQNYNPDTSNAKIGAVLIALFPDEKGAVRTVLMKRPDYDGTHSGQISFPGGKMEDADANVVQTALREADEEVNIKPEEVKVIGQLTNLYIPPSNFLVHPVLGILEKPPLLIPDEHEVQSIHIPEISYLLRDDIIEEKDIILSSGFKMRTPYFLVDGHTVWGATAMMLAELKEIMRAIGI